MIRLWQSLLPISIFTLLACHPQKTTEIPPQISDLSCKNFYTQFYKKDHLDFRIVFGYKDARPARYVGDRYESAYFIQKLLHYGFVRDSNQENSFSFHRLGLDGQRKEINLTVVWSSAGPDDDENRKDPFQKWSSHRAEETFLEGLHAADLVFYYGHSRDGGGPDFYPPQILSDLHPDYHWYQKHQPGLIQMKNALSDAPKGPKILGLYSCVSNRLFTRTIHALKPKMGLLVSPTLLYYIDALDGMLEAITDLLEMKCQKDFHPSGTDVLYFF